MRTAVEVGGSSSVVPVPSQSYEDSVRGLASIRASLPRGNPMANYVRHHRERVSSDRGRGLPPTEDKVDVR